jgi:anaerobic magnesium-protoporphyrin IX monomethyl ester cyclase
VIALYESGCETVWMGAESGSQKILDAMDKGIRIEQIKTAAQFLKKYNIKTGLFIQFGYPGETIDDIRDTISLILQIMPEEIGISVSYPLPGTKFYEKVKNELSSKKNWSDSDDLALMFSGNYPPEFYKTLHRFVHPYFRFHQCLNSKKTFSFKKIVRLPYYFFKYKAAFKILTKTVPDAEKLL